MRTPMSQVLEEKTLGEAANKTVRDSGPLTDRRVIEGG
jgi:hypothetical protein